jgi:integrase
MLKAFEAFLLRNKAVKSKYIPYYIKWVSDCYKFLEESPSNRVGSDQRKEFLLHLERHHEDWQVRQADTALRLYDFFISKEGHQRSSLSPSHKEAWAIMADRMRQALRLRHRSFSTERTYMMWLGRFQAFVKEKNPFHLQGSDLRDFLSHLALEKRVSASTQNQALNAIVFFFRHVLEKDIENELSAVRARQRRRLPVVLTPREVREVFRHMSGVQRLMAMLIYGCGLRLHECVRLRVKDLDIEQNSMTVRSGKGDEDRVTVLPESVKDELIRHIAQVRSIYENDRKNGINGVWLPDALERKYPEAGKEWVGSGCFQQSPFPSIHAALL